MLLRVRGRGCASLFASEAGGHRWQRIPPNDKRGRVHTSTVTVAVLREASGARAELDPRDLEETFTGGSGSGGQHQNKRSTAVVLVHKPTGIRVRIEGRSQHVNRVTAVEVMQARVHARRTGQAELERNSKRKSQVGSGMRGDKVRTVRVRDGTVVDHRSGKRTTYRRYQRGHLRDLQ